MWKMRSFAIVATLALACLNGVAPRTAMSANTEAGQATAPLAGKAPGATKGAAVSDGTAPKSAVKPGTYVVRTVWKNAPLSNVRVEWRHQPDDAKPLLSGTTIRFGTSIFRPDSGTYYLTAEWRQDGDFARPRKQGDRFAWLGGNPLRVSSEVSEMITLMLEEVPPPLTAPAPPGTGIFGLVTLNGAAVPDVGVYAYAKTGSGFKGDDFQATVRTNEKGEFALELPPDRYYLLARLRSDNSVDLGPLHKEDLLGYDPGNPVVVKKGHYTATTIPVARLKMVKSRAESSAFPQGVIEGRIVDRKGHPVQGAYAALYDKSNMSGRSVFRSDPTGADGRFKLLVPTPGSYFLGARNGYGSPTAGTWFGQWRGSADHAIMIKKGELRTGVEIIVDKLAKDIDPARNQ